LDYFQPICGVSANKTTALPGTRARLSTMAQPNKGDRQQVSTRLPRAVYAAVKVAAAERGTTVSQYIADLTCAHFGRSDLMYLLDQEVLPQSA